MQELFLKALTELHTRLMSVRDETGQAMVEYGILLALISVAALVFIPGVGTAVSNAFSTVSDKLTP
jgi:pilus assembly protein Flp/PilA